MDAHRTNQVSGSISNQPEDCGSAHLPLRAEALLKILRRYLGRNRYCWPSQKKLAAEMGVSGRTVCFWIRYLENAGKIEIERTNRTNRYYIPPRAGSKKTSHPNTQVSSGSDTQKPSDPDTQKSSYIDETPICGTKFREGGIKEDAHFSTGVAENQMQGPGEKEHPVVDDWLLKMHAFDALPELQKKRIESAVREAPLFATRNSGDHGFRMECVKLMVEWRADEERDAEFERGWRAFKTDFIKYFHPRNPDFLDRVKALFGPPSISGTKGINATPDEMMYALECYLSDPRRFSGNWDGRFLTEAHRYLPKYITQRRKALEADAQRAEWAANRARQKECAANRAAEVTDTEDEFEPDATREPVVFATDPDCARVASALVERIGEASFNLWFVGKTRLTREGADFIVGVRNQLLQDFLRNKFLADAKAAVAIVVGGEASVKFVIDPSLSEAVRVKEKQDKRQQPQ